MRKTENNKEYLPAIFNSQANENKKIKDLLMTLKEKKYELQGRLLRTQTNEEEMSRDEEAVVKEYSLRERVITEIPCYQRRRKLLQKEVNSEALKSFNYTSNKIESASPEGSTQSRQKNRKSFLEPVVNAAKSKNKARQARELQMENFNEIFERVPRRPSDRTDENIDPLIRYLVDNNMFFAKINPTLINCFLKLNRFLTPEKNQILYRNGDEKDAIYIVLIGKIKLTNNSISTNKFKKICYAGETIGQELLFCKSIKKTVLETAKALSKTVLIEIKLQNYQKMREEMTKYGYKLIFQEMESIIKRNYIMKNWQREGDRHPTKR